MISVIIPAYKKTEQLIENLQNNYPFFKGCEVIVVNDDPTRSIYDAIKDFKNIKLIENTKNLGFAGAVNTGMKTATGNYFMLLNSDVVLRDDSFQKAIAYFEKDPRTFGVGFAQIERHGDIVGKNIFLWSQGQFLHNKAPNIYPGVNAWAEGGASIFDAQKVKKLNYFDELFSPFYWEDIDLSFRAWKQGYNVVFAPEIMVEHHHESTISAFYKRNRIKKIAYRNQLLFTWKNITDANLLSSHILMLPLNIIRMILKGEFVFLLAFIEALAYSNKIVRKSFKVTKSPVVSDQEVLNKFS